MLYKFANTPKYGFYYNSVNAKSHSIKHNVHIQLKTSFRYFKISKS